MDRKFEKKNHLTIITVSCRFDIVIIPRDWTVFRTIAGDHHIRRGSTTIGTRYCKSRGRRSYKDICIMGSRTVKKWSDTILCAENQRIKSRWLQELQGSDQLIASQIFLTISLFDFKVFSSCEMCSHLYSELFWFNATCFFLLHLFLHYKIALWYGALLHIALNQ